MSGTPPLEQVADCEKDSQRYVNIAIIGFHSFTRLRSVGIVWVGLPMREAKGHKPDVG